MVVRAAADREPIEPVRCGTSRRPPTHRSRRRSRESGSRGTSPEATRRTVPAGWRSPGRGHRIATHRARGGGRRHPGRSGTGPVNSISR
jgi:hypothetical protein